MDVDPGILSMIGVVFHTVLEEVFPLRVKKL